MRTFLCKLVGKFFSCTARSFDDFVKIVQKTGCKVVAVTPCVVARNGVPTSSVILIADFECVLTFRASTPGGRQVVYEESLFQWFGSSSGFLDARERNQAIKSLLMSTKKRARETQERLPDTKVYIIAPKQLPLD